LFDGRGKDEGFVGPGFCVLGGGEVIEARDLVGFGDVADEGRERGVSALEGPIEDV
jgi:hypothetical protein